MTTKTLTESQAWQEIADRLSLMEVVFGEGEANWSAAPLWDYLLTGICHELDELHDEGLIPYSMYEIMRDRQNAVFTEDDRIEAGNTSEFWWPMGDPTERIIAAQLLSCIAADSPVHDSVSVTVSL